jgi:hypothetical protein
MDKRSAFRIHYASARNLHVVPFFFAWVKCACFHSLVTFILGTSLVSEAYSLLSEGGTIQEKLRKGSIVE